ncbi:MAG: acid phosphatase [Vulcanimicrobiaceae bacterium]
MPAADAAQQLAQFKSKIDHIVIVYQENWGFDSLYGRFPGANGYANASSITAQVDASGKPITTLPPVLNGTMPDPQFAALNSANLPVAPFDLSAYVPTTGMTGDPNHNFYLQQAQIDGGRMDRYLAYNGPGQGGLTFGYYDATNLPEGKLAQQYVLADNFHQDAFGGSFLNNMYAACACTPQIPIASVPAAKIEPVDASGNPTALGGSEGRVTPDGFVVNTSYSTQYPQIVNFTTSNRIVPPLANPTLGDRLSAANVPWKFYAGGLDNAIAGNADPTFQPHHQSYLYFSNYAPGTPGASHIVDDSNFLKDLSAGTLPAVSWVKPLGANNEHPGYANLITGQMFVANLVSQIQMSPAWKSTLVVVIYDEAGGHYDHAAPMSTDRFGPATRVPAIFISPFAKRGYVDHSNLTVSSILRTIELRYGLDPLTARDAQATPLVYSAFDFSQAMPAAFARKSLGDIPRVPVAPMPQHYAGHSMTELDYDE